MPLSLSFIKNVLQSRDRGQKLKISLDNKAASGYNEPLNIHYILHCMKSSSNKQTNKIAQIQIVCLLHSQKLSNP